MNKEQVLSLARSVLKAVGGALASSGVIQESSVEVLVGAAVLVIGAIWSHFNHKEK